MNQEDFERNKKGYLKGGTKEACVTIREALISIRTHKGSIAPDSFSFGENSTVSMEDFLEAVKTLMAFSYSQEDTIPERFQCVDADCKYNYHTTFCPGEFRLGNEATLERKKCPYYREWD